jgi:hippurate hydrolase
MEKYLKLVDNKELLNHYKFLHQNPEIGFDLNVTYQYVFNELIKLGYTPVPCGKCGLYIDIGNNKNKIVLLRADMDALKIIEDTNLPYKSNNSSMHACGHDMHTTMLLGAAKLLKNFEFDGCIRLMFQPAEEIISGCKEMIENGVLKNVHKALMLHVMPNTLYPTGTVIVPDSGIITPSCDNFQIKLFGKSAHGGFPHLGIDIFTVSSLICLGIQNIKNSELTLEDKVVISLGEITAGNTYNVIPDTLYIKGMIRTFNNEVRKFIKYRIEEIIRCICKAYNVKYKFIIDQSVCPFNNNENLRNEILDVFDNKNVIYEKIKTTSSGGAEDFAEVSKLIPTNMLMLCAGKKDDGYCYNIHHPKTIFDTNALKYGTVIYTMIGLELVKISNIKK